ncbi:MAG: right-handed parallel beta-helix repeat-containing protein [Deltaproteobacteria bacterium]|nr:right-handed parallel beta-helix repeat-containing protein [Deltaproteobacteria bacterium]
MSVTTEGGTGESEENFTFIEAPTITSFTPTSGGKDTSVTITGTYFTDATKVMFGDTDAASFTVDSETQITAIVGEGSTGKITVTTPGGTAESEGVFTYTEVVPSVYWVDLLNGSDNNNGSEETPWKTLHHAITQINGGIAGTSIDWYTLNVKLPTGSHSYSIGDGEDDSELIVSQNYVTIVGESGSGPIIDGTGATNWTKGIKITGSDVKLYNLYITNFSDENESAIYIDSGSGHEINNCELYRNRDAIVVNPTASHFTITNCTLYDNSRYGMYLLQSQNGSILANRIYGTVSPYPQYGIYVIACSPQIKRNTIYDVNNGIVVLACIHDASPDIWNNLIYEASSSPTTNAMSNGILILSNSSKTAGPRIYHNTIDGGTFMGIKMVFGEGSGAISPEIKYNIITNFGEFGIYRRG